MGSSSELVCAKVDYIIYIYMRVLLFSYICWNMNQHWALSIEPHDPIGIRMRQRNVEVNCEELNVST